ncbi:MAG: hypothetical protein II575_04280, partial [Bacteroidales bacterium]|nr:hypothetical protein [Bacteroidales bacterium]
IRLYRRNSLRLRNGAAKETFPSTDAQGGVKLRNQETIRNLETASAIKRCRHRNNLRNGVLQQAQQPPTIKRLQALKLSNGEAI